MSEHVLPGDPPIAVNLRRSARARRMTLRVSSLDGRVTLTLPKRVALRAALDFARAKEGWLRKTLAAQAPEVIVAPGARVPVAGVPMTVVQGAGRQIVQTGDEIAVPGPPERVGTRLAAHLKAQARDRLAAACDHYAAQLRRPYARLTLRDTRSRWGSCSGTGGLMFSWRLVMAPPEVLDYVAAHEVAHLAEMNHSPAFWAEVAALYGDYDAPRRWLRREGNALHRYRF